MSRAGALSTRGLVKRYGEKTVVRGLDIEVNPGEIVGLLGPNGAGKTTTFNMIVGGVRPDDMPEVLRAGGIGAAVAGGLIGAKDVGAEAERYRRGGGAEGRRGRRQKPMG